MDKKEKTVQALSKKKSSLMELEVQAKKVCNFLSFIFLFNCHPSWRIFIM
jgi:hypothetical protein